MIFIPVPNILSRGTFLSVLGALGSIASIVSLVLYLHDKKKWGCLKIAKCPKRTMSLRTSPQTGVAIPRIFKLLR